MYEGRRGRRHAGEVGDGRRSDQTASGGAEGKGCREHLGGSELNWTCSVYLALDPHLYLEQDTFSIDAANFPSVSLKTLLAELP
ncbi:hypothetical protein AMECASPLE_026220 [Ameca splendens]|uniref:Uncharacterized protein n=1 Tax=Ameca splendens TaxID=208324 RepID=A0ABV1A0E7_9TELE